MKIEKKINQVQSTSAISISEKIGSLEFHDASFKSDNNINICSIVSHYSGPLQ